MIKPIMTEMINPIITFIAEKLSPGVHEMLQYNSDYDILSADYLNTTINLVE